MKANALKLILGTFGLALLTAPFVWLKLNYDFHQGTVSAEWNFFQGWQLIKNLIPLFAILFFIFLFRRFKRKKILSHTAPSNQSTFLVTLLANPKFHLALFLILAVSGFFFTSYTLNLAIFVGLYMIQALGLNIAVGMTGLLVLGYAGFFAVGGYSFAILQQMIPGLTWWMSLPAVLLVGAVMGWLVGLPCLRLRGDYLAIVTLGFAESFRELMRNLTDLTGGDKGIRLALESKINTITLSPHIQITSIQLTYVIVLIFIFLCALVLHRLYHSRIGRAWIAIREDETAAAAMGIPVVKMKLTAFMLSSAFAALAGLLYVAYIGFLDPSAARFEESALVLAMVILGGLGNIPGSLLGSALLYLIPALLRDQFPALADYRLLLFGALMVIMMLYRPQGLLGNPRRRLELKTESAT
ncbi:MAG: branched-chain amino acid ABC transporter permease [Verrucomicrobiia bacterium]